MILCSSNHPIIGLIVLTVPTHPLIATEKEQTCPYEVSDDIASAVLGG